MKFLSLLLLVLTSAAFGATAQVNNVQMVGGGGTSSSPGVIIPEGNAAGYKTLLATADTAGANSTYWRFTDPSNSVASYQVPAGKKFQITSMCIISTCSTLTDCEVTLGTGTAAVTNGSASAPAGDFPWITATPSGNNATLFGLVNSNGALTCVQLPFSFAQNLFPYMKVGVIGFQTVYLIGKEI